MTDFHLKPPQPKPTPSPEFLKTKQERKKKVEKFLRKGGRSSFFNKCARYEDTLLPDSREVCIKLFQPDRPTG
jgi:hypothetical protein